MIRGRELFYVSPANALMRIGVERAASWAATTPTMLLKAGSVMTVGNDLGRNYDISPDGQRFLVVKPGRGAHAASAAAPESRAGH